MKKTRWILAVLLLLCLLFGCSRNDNQEAEQGEHEISETVSAEKPVEGGTLRIYSQNADTLNPIFTQVRSNANLLNLVYDSLYVLDSTMRPIPRIVRSASVDSTGLVWTFHLKDNITFHSGASLTANDVVYTVNQIKSVEDEPVELSVQDKAGTGKKIVEKSSLYIENVKNISSCRANGSDTVIINLKERDSGFPSLLTFPIIHQVSGDGYQNFEPDGSGPFRYETIVEGKEVHLNKNEAWKGEHLPYVDLIKVTILNDMKSAINAYEINLLDLLPVDYSNISEATIKKESKKYQCSTNNFTFLCFNHANNFLGNYYVRAAISHMVDKEKLVEQTAYSYAKKADTPVHPASYLYNGEYARNFDLKYAKEILAENGFVDKDADNVLEIQKQKLSFSILVNEDNENRILLAQLISGMLKEGGIQITVETVPFEEYEQRIENKEYDMFLGEMNLSPNMSFRHLLYATEELDNYAGYYSEAMNGILDAIDMSNTDEALRLEAYKQFQKQFSADVPFIALYYKDNIIYYNSFIRGVENPYFNSDYGNIYNVFIKK